MGKKTPDKELDELTDEILEDFGKEKPKSEGVSKKSDTNSEEKVSETDLQELLVEDWIPEGESSELAEQINNLSNKFRINPKIVRAIVYTQMAKTEDVEGVDDEITSLEDMVQEALTDLTDTDENLIDIISPSGTFSSEGKSLMLVRRFQNSMKEALDTGIANRDMEKFLEGFDFFESAIEILTSTGNHSEIAQVRTELINDLKKILDDPQSSNPDFRPFAFQACKIIAETYDSFDDFSTALQFHNRAGNLQENALIAHIEYIQVAFDYLLMDQIDDAKDYVNNMQLKNLKTLANQFIDATIQQNNDILKKIQARIKEIGLKKSVDLKNTMILIDSIKSAIRGVEVTTTLEKVTVPPIHGQIPSDKLEGILRSIEQLKANQPSKEGIAPIQVDKSGIIAELKKTLSSELNKEIKTLSKDLLMKLLSKLPTGVGTSAPIRSAGYITDEGRPEIEIVGHATGEKPKRPKLDDMLDSIIVSE